MSKTITILGIESSCDDTAAAIISNGKILANVVANQNVHKAFGGVVPELASRAHQQNIIPVVDRALKLANIKKEDLSAIAFTRGPGLMGSLLVGSSFAKAFSLGLNIPLIEVNHLQGHILSHFIKSADGSGPDEEKGSDTSPAFPFLCLTVSGGHTQIVLVNDFFDMHVIGETIDDAAGEAFDKAAKIMGLPYPGGPLIDKYSKKGDPEKFIFSKPKVEGLNFSFSGLKTGFMNFIHKETTKDHDFIEKNKAHLCASIQHTIIDMLMEKLKKASMQTGIREIAIAGGVSSNSSLRDRLSLSEKELNWKVFIPKPEYCTDNAAMIAITGYYKYLQQDFTTQACVPMPRYNIDQE